MTTSVGFGIALPHPRVPLISGEKDERIFVCYLENEIDFNAMDGVPVNNLFIILSDGSKNHLNVLSNLSYLFQQDQFREILALKPGIKELTAAVKQYLQ
ncbi:PTS sugar transporter subunit IIA [Brucepastera parasyntrophica]|uniref:PTS sugar transporter subunit IIA n=1 Tax=Brucepastera parasyntrophica TaxID=2880008 RepID=UPI0021097E0A|nr:PTS sugar transporter subunit IIA [Brucepastera parasyntrophica]